MINFRYYVVTGNVLDYHLLYITSVSGMGFIVFIKTDKLIFI